MRHPAGHVDGDRTGTCYGESDRRTVRENCDAKTLLHVPHSLPFRCARGTTVAHIDSSAPPPAPSATTPNDGYRAQLQRDPFRQLLIFVRQPIGNPARAIGRRRRTSWLVLAHVVYLINKE
jgi:hypothetical protein